MHQPGELSQRFVTHLSRWGRSKSFHRTPPSPSHKFTSHLLTPPPYISTRCLHSTPPQDAFPYNSTPHLLSSTFLHLIIPRDSASESHLHLHTAAGACLYYPTQCQHASHLFAGESGYTFPLACRNDEMCSAIASYPLCFHEWKPVCFAVKS